MSGIAAVGYFLFNLVFSAVTFFLWIRFALRYFRVSSLHPISQTIDRFTYPIIRPIQGLFTSSNIRSNRYDWACLSTLVIVEVLKFILFGLLFSGTFPSIIFLLLHALGELILEPCNLMFYAILIRVIISWVNPLLKNPMMDLLYLFTEPLLRLARSFVPVFSGIDFSPFIVMIALKVITLFIGASLPPSFF